MYGQIHCILKDLVVTAFGEETWNTVVEESGVDEDEDFMVFKNYPDEKIYALIAAVSAITEYAVHDVMQLFGTHFLGYCLRNGYDKMLTSLGGGVVSFIQNLDSLHSMLSFAYPGISSPSFRCIEEDDKMTLHYYSAREGLYPIVIGLVEAVAKDLFHQTAKLTLISAEKESLSDDKKPLYHTVLEIQINEEDSEDALVTSQLGQFEEVRGMIYKRRGTNVNAISEDAGTPTTITMEDMALALPYHILLDPEMRIVQCGEYIKKLSATQIEEDMTPLKKVGIIVHPLMQMTSVNIMNFINSVFIFALHASGPAEKPFIVKGQMSWLSHSRQILFLGSPQINTLEEMKEIKMCIADIPIYDVTRELVMLNQQRLLDLDTARKLEETTVQLKKMSRKLSEEKLKTEELLFEMMPRKIARQLICGEMAKAERYTCATVLFSDIVGFTEISSKCPADELINMLNELYQRFDAHTESHDVYKVETIGDAYMAVTGVPEVQTDHAERMADFSMDMLEMADFVTSPTTGKALRIRVGFHSGQLVAGVIGKKKPRYDIYGDTVNTASRMETKSVPGRIHVSNSTFGLLFPRGYMFKVRGEVAMKGKGLLKTFFLTGCSGKAIKQPNDQFSPLKDVYDPLTRDGEDASLKKLNFHLKAKQIAMATYLKIAFQPSTRSSEVLNTGLQIVGQSPSKGILGAEPMTVNTKRRASRKSTVTSNPMVAFSVGKPAKPASAPVDRKGGDELIVGKPGSAPTDRRGGDEAGHHGVVSASSHAGVMQCLSPFRNNMAFPIRKPIRSSYNRPYPTGAISALAFSLPP